MVTRSSSDHSALAQSLFVDCAKATARAASAATGAETPRAPAPGWIAPAFGRAAAQWFAQKTEPEQQEALRALAKLPYKTAFELTRQAARDAQMTPQMAESLGRFLAAVPMTTAQAIAHLLGGVQSRPLLIQVPQTELGFARLLPLRTPLFQPGDRVPGRDYIVERLLGQGGFGEVWAARHALNDDDVRSYKFCARTGEDAAQASAALENEIELVSRLNSPASTVESYTDGQRHIVTLLDTNILDDPGFVGYEYVAGGNLVSWVNARADRRPQASEVTDVLDALARALAFAHGRGVVHQDLKPGNVLVTTEGTVKLTDFGIGRLDPRVDESHGGKKPDSSTATASRVGTATPSSASTSKGASDVLHAQTPTYADPYAVQGPAFDVYSFGVLAFQLLVGDLKRAPASDHAQALNELELPEPLVELVTKCMQPPKDRYTDGGALLEAIGQVRAQQDTAPANSDAKVADDWKDEATDPKVVPLSAFITDEITQPLAGRKASVLSSAERTPSIEPSARTIAPTPRAKPLQVAAAAAVVAAGALLLWGPEDSADDVDTTEAQSDDGTTDGARAAAPGAAEHSAASSSANPRERLYRARLGCADHLSADGLRLKAKHVVQQDRRHQHLPEYRGKADPQDEPDAEFERYMPRENMIERLQLDDSPSDESARRIIEDRLPLIEVYRRNEEYVVEIIETGPAFDDVCN